MEKVANIEQTEEFVPVKSVQPVESLTDMQKRMIKLSLDKAVVDAELAVKNAERKDLMKNGVLPAIEILGGTALFLAGIGGFLGLFFSETSALTKDILPICSCFLAAGGMGSFIDGADTAKGKTAEEVFKTGFTEYKKVNKECKELKEQSKRIKKDMANLGKKITKAKKQPREIEPEL